jgi:hypothetical protein
MGFLMVAALMVTGAAIAFADSGMLNVEVPDKTGYANDQTTDGAIVEYIGDSNLTFGSAGSGIFEAFLRTHASPSEQGYNSDLAKKDFEFDEVSGNFTRSILVSEIPVVECESVDGSITEDDLCWELFADINDSNSTPLIQLTDLEIWFSDEASPTGYPFGSPIEKVYDFEGEVLINDVNQGSGRGDLRYLVPLGDIEIPEDCDYGNSVCATFFVVYTQWGDPNDEDYATDAGFNEWKVKRYPFLEVTKDADTSLTRTFNWDIDKSVDPDTWDLFTGESGTSEYTIDITLLGFTDSDWAVSGTITINNPSDQDAPIESVEDVISGVGSVSVDCGVTFPYVLGEGDTLVCTYESDLTDGASRTNEAIVTLDTSQVFTGDADVDFSTATITEVDPEVNVSDTLGGSFGPFTGTDSVSYTETFECDGDEGTHDNTATIVETGQSDSASVTVNCWDLTVTKDADTSLTRTYDWTLVKEVSIDGGTTWVDSASVEINVGESQDYLWRLVATKSAGVDSDWAVEGEITITNNHPTRVAEITAVSDVVSPAIAANVDCGVTFPHDIAANGGTLTCDYDADLPDASDRTNTATATQQLYDFDEDGVGTADGTMDYSGNADVDFSTATITEVDESATLSDPEVPSADGMTITAGGTFLSGTLTYTCGETTLIVNTALLTEDDSGQIRQGSADLTVTCVPVFEGCTPGFWQGGNGVSLWDDPNDTLSDAVEAALTGYGLVLSDDFYTGAQFNDIFGGTDTRTLLEIVSSGGGPDFEDKAKRDLIAALLNAVDDEIDYPASVDEILDDFFASDFVAFHEKYGAFNELGCDRTDASSAWVFALPLAVLGAELLRRGRHERNN